VTAARYRREDVIEDRFYYEALGEISAVASAGFPVRWLADLGLGPRPVAPGDWAWDNAYDRVSVRVGNSAGSFERGMLAGLSVTLGEWHAAGGRALASWPLERTAVTDVPGLSFSVEPPDADRPGWRLSAALSLQPRRPQAAPRGLFARLVAVVAAPLVGAARPESPRRWSAEEVFPDRAALVAAVSPASARLVVRVRSAAGDWWPRRPAGG
jgi:hypothetical protein